MKLYEIDLKYTNSIIPTGLLVAAYSEFGARIYAQRLLETIGIKVLQNEIRLWEQK